MRMVSHGDMVANILHVHDSGYFAAPDLYVSGERWYADAHYICKAFAAESGYSLEQCAAVFSIFSPLKPVKENIRLAARMIESRGTMNSGTFSTHIRKAQAILALDRPVSLDDIASKRHEKTRNFYLGIVARGENDTVCVDRHAYCIAVNSREDTGDVRLNVGEYNAIAAAYRDAAAQRGISPAQMQAIVWTVWRGAAF